MGNRYRKHRHPRGDAQRIRVEDIAEMMTALLLQTDRDSRRGMKLNNTGISVQRRRNRP